MVVLDFIMDKIKEKPELVKPFPEGVDTKMPQDRDKQVRTIIYKEILEGEYKEALWEIDINCNCKAVSSCEENQQGK